MASTTQTPTPEAPLSYSTDDRYFATRYKQGGRTVFAFQLTPAEITSLVKRPNPEGANPGNRRIRLSHAQGFAKYFLNHEQWVIPGIILRAPSIFQFEENSELSPPGATFGYLSYPRRNQSDIHVLDGQHRILGFFLADEMLAHDLDKARDERATAKRTEGDKSVAHKQAQQKIKRLEAVRDRFHTERVSVEIQVTDDMALYRQMFYDIADNALGITASVKARFDTRKVVNRALPTVLDHPLLANRTDLEVDRIRKSSPNYLTAKQVVEVLRVLTVGFDGRVSRRMEAELTEGGVAQSATKFFDTLVETFPQLKAVEQGTLLPDGLRESSLLGSALFIRILAGAWYSLTQKHAFTAKMVATFFQKLVPHLEVPIHANTIWMRELPPEIFNEGARGPNGQRQAATALVAALVDWAIVTPDFLDAEPLPAPESSTDPDEGMFSDLHDTKKLDVEERNAIEEIATDSKKKAARRTRAKKE